MKSVYVGVSCLCLLASCKPMARQEVSDTELAFTLRTIMRAMVAPFRSRKTAALSLARGFHKQKNYDALAAQLQDLREAVLEVREGYVDGTRRRLGGFTEHPTAADHGAALKKQVAQDYGEWAAEIKTSMVKSLHKNKLYQPARHRLPTGLKEGRPQTMGELSGYVDEVYELLDTPLDLS